MSQNTVGVVEKCLKPYLPQNMCTGVFLHGKRLLKNQGYSGSNENLGILEEARYWKILEWAYVIF